MSFVSYAQNFEDVMLWRALKHIEKGFYVDVGAQDPIIDSVSKAFYELGWRGIHIEPMPQYAELLRKDRPDETVLQVALADSEGTLQLNVIPDTGLSTFVDAYANRHKVERGYEHQRIQVPVLTLKSALRSFVGKDVHWLKIDVEGFEEKVLRGWDSQTLRPWVMVVEATIPSSPETGYASWDPILTAANYQFVYFDGLNRFYIAKEHAELAEAFSCPPNVFDGVELSGLASWGLCRGLIESHQASEKGLATQAEKLATELNEANERNTQLQAHAEKVDKLTVELNEANERNTQLQAHAEKVDKLTVELNVANEHNTHLQAHAEWLRNEWDAAKQRIEWLSYQAGTLETTLSVEREQNSRRESELIDARQQLEQLQSHARWLQNEWDAANVKIDEFNQASHHWWTAADQLNRELQGVYASKSWRITLPLRKSMHAARWVLALSTRTVRGADCLPQRIANALVVGAMRKAVSNPRLKSRASQVLTKHPRLKQQLRQIAIRSGLMAGWGMASPTSHPFKPGSDRENTVTIAYPPSMPEKSIKNLSLRAAHIYADLKKAIDARKS